MIPKNFKRDKNECKKKISKYGYYLTKTDYTENINFFNNLLCMINGHSLVEYLPYYPVIFIFKESDFINQVKIAYLAMKNKVKLLPVADVGSDNISCYVFNTIQGRNNAILYKYLKENIDNKNLLGIIKVKLFGSSKKL